MALGGTVDILATDDPDAVADEHEELQIYEKHNNLLHGSKRKKYARSIKTSHFSLLINIPFIIVKSTLLISMTALSEKLK